MLPHSLRSLSSALALPGVVVSALLIVCPASRASDADVADLRKKVEGALKRGKGDYFVIALSATSFHPGDAVMKTTFIPHPGGVVEKIDDFPASQPGVVYPVTSADFRVIEGYEAAVDAVLEHMRQYPPPPKRAEPRPKAPTAASAPMGEWRLLGRAAGAAQAETVQRKARAAYDMLPKWQLKDHGEEVVPGAARRR